LRHVTRFFIAALLKWIYLAWVVTMASEMDSAAQQNLMELPVTPKHSTFFCRNHSPTLALLVLFACQLLMMPRASAATANGLHTVGSQSATYSVLYQPTPLANNLTMVAAATGDLYGFSLSNNNVVRIKLNGESSLVHTFSATEGWVDTAISAPGGNVYGETVGTYAPAGTQPWSIIYRIDQNGAYSLLHVFAPVDNPGTVSSPYINADGAGSAVLVVDTTGTLYGAKVAGGSNGNGTLFKIAPDGQFTLLHTFSAADPNTFSNADGADPYGLLLGADGSVYGMTISGGKHGKGTFFKINADSSLSTVYSFDNKLPGFNGYVIAGRDGNFYGTAGGVAHSLSPQGQTKRLFASASMALGRLIQGSDGNFYGVESPRLFRYGPQAIFRLTPSGRHTVLHKFDRNGWSYDCAVLFLHCDLFNGQTNFDGWHSALVLNSDGAFYGVAYAGGADEGGLIYKVTEDGSFSVLFAFGSASGGRPGSLAQGIDGNLYGTIDSNAIFKLQPHGPMTVSASFSPSTVEVGGKTALTWNSTGAESCQILSVDLGLRPQPGDTTATSGSLPLTAPRQLNIELGDGYGIDISQDLSRDYIAEIQCTAADGSLANALAQLRLPGWYLANP